MSKSLSRCLSLCTRAYKKKKPQKTPDPQHQTAWGQSYHESSNDVPVPSVQTPPRCCRNSQQLQESRFAGFSCWFATRRQRLPVIRDGGKETPIQEGPAEPVQTMLENGNFHNGEGWETDQNSCSGRPAPTGQSQCHETPGADRSTSLLSSLEVHFLAEYKIKSWYRAAFNSLSARMPPKGQIAIYSWPDLENKWHLSRLILLWTIKASTVFLTQGTSCTYKYRHTRLPSKSGD